MRSTHSLATLPISKAAYEEIANKLIAAGYNRCFLIVGHSKNLDEELKSGNATIDMHGIGLVLEQEETGDGTGNCFKCGRAMQSANRAGQFICFDCGKTPTEDEIHPKEELSRRDKNYYLGKENK
jgi:hypothetical protein